MNSFFGFAFLLMTCVGLVFSGTPGTPGFAPCNGSNCGAPGWSSAALVKEIDASVSPAGGYLFSYFRINNSECQTGTSGGGTPQLESSGTDALSIARLQSMRTILLTAQSTGSLVRVHWAGNYCWADNVMICSDATCSAFQ